MRTRQGIVHSDREIDGIRKAARATAGVRDALGRRVQPGMSTLELDRLAADLIAKTGGTSAFHGYHGFPGQVCISVNEEVVHGIGRADRIINLGDIVSIDVGITLNGFVGDTATTVCVPANANPAIQNLLETTRQSLAAGIAAARPGGFVNDIGTAVEHVVTRAGFSVVRDFVGHGCGCELHEPPEIPNFRQSQKGAKLKAGMVLAIEPMVNSGSASVSVDSDGWTVRTKDGGLSAHFEHMVLITNAKPEILT